MLGRIGGCVGEGVLSHARLAPHRAPEGDEWQHDQRDRCQDEAGELGRGHHHHRDGAEAQDDVAQGDGCGRADRRLDLGRVGRQAGDDLARLRGVEEGRRQAGDMREHLAADVGHNALAERDDEIVAACRGQGEHRGDRHQHREIIGDEGRIGAGEAVVDHAADRKRQRQRRRGGKAQKEQRGGDLAAIAHQIGEELAQRPDRTPFLDDVDRCVGHFPPPACAAIRCTRGLVVSRRLMYRHADLFGSRSPQRPRLQVFRRG